MAFVSDSDALTPPDIIVLGSAWRDRALLRAQLIEEGFDVVATDAWPMPRQYRRPGAKPRVMIVDLQGLPEPRAVLDQLRFVVPADHVVAVTALDTLNTEEVGRLGYHVVSRPTSMAQIVTTAAALLGTIRSSEAGLVREKGTAMQLELSRDEAEVLQQLLQHKVEELDKEINRTDSLTFKRELQRTGRMVERILDGLTASLRSS